MSHESIGIKDIMGFGATIGALAAGAVVVYSVAEDMYHRNRFERYTPEQFERATAPSSMIPFIANTFEWLRDEGVEAVLAGGIAKKALEDPETIFDIEHRRMIVSDDPQCHARRHATLLRPDEITERDIDIFAKFIRLDGNPTIVDQSSSEMAAVLSEKRLQLQTAADQFAQEQGFDIGPDVSLFGYDAKSDKVGYATRTYRNDDGTETLTDNLGHEHRVPCLPEWTLVIGDLEIPVNSPAVQLGRTLTRTLVSRQRDLRDVQKAIDNLKSQGVWAHEATAFAPYQLFREQMDASLTRRSIMQQKGLGKQILLAAANVVAPFATQIEGSELVSAAIRDRRGRVALAAAKLMGAKTDTAKAAA